MSIDALRDKLPAYAKDVAHNLCTLAEETLLSDQQKWGCFLACAYAIGQGEVIRAIEDAAKLGEEAKTAAKAAAAVMGMNNVYYRAVHLMKNPEYGTMPVRLRMSVIGKPGVEKVDFELWCLAVSAVNGCGLCLDSHDEVLRKHAVPAQHVQAALRIAAVVNAASRVLAAEGAGEPNGGSAQATDRARPAGVPDAPPTGIPAG